MKIDFIDLERQQKRIRKEVNSAISNVLNSGQYIMGDECRQLEVHLAKYVGTEFCLTCGNGTDAIRIALIALGIKPGDMIFTTNFTFFATAEVIAELGAIPIFVDTDSTYNICPNDLEYKVNLALTNRYPIRGIISVDLFGLPCDHIKINTIALKYQLWHVEDGAQGFGGKIGEELACSFGHVSTTSFFPAKPLGCYGDGGAVFTSNEKLASKMDSLRVHGKGNHKYENINIGYNSRLDTIQAAILIEKLKIFDDEVKAKNHLAALYNDSFRNFDRIKLPIVPEGFLSSWAQYSITVNDRDLLVNKLKEKKIPTAVYYPKTMYHTKALRKYQQYQFGNLTNSEALCGDIVSLPMHAYLTEEEKEFIIESVTSVLQN